MKLLLLSVLVISMSVELPPAVAEECSSVLITWWSEGCKHDYSDTECKVDEQNVEYQGDPYNPTAGCGWGGINTDGRSHHYNCPGNEQRTCTTLCYVPCPGETLPSCSGNCKRKLYAPCSKETCGVGIAYHAFLCPGSDRVLCTMECCCKKCTGGRKGAVNVRVCLAENMEVGLAFPNEYCMDNIT